MSSLNVKNIINKNLKEVKQVANRVGFGEGLLLAGKYDERVVALCADLTESTQVHLFKAAFPKRFFEMGVAEQNMASVASGMAAMGKIPFIASYAMFSPGRNWEQIRTTIAYNNVPVVIVGCHAGLSVGPDGGTHQALEDIALMNTMPNMIVIVPCDAQEAKKATLALAKLGMPAYLRLAREKSPIVTDENTEFAIGKANILYESRMDGEQKDFDKKVGIVACGEMVSRALLCVAELENLGYEVGVMNMHTVKPLDKKSLINFAKYYKNITTAEEHQINGGLGSVVAQALLEEVNENVHFKFAQVAVMDAFGQSGKKEELFDYYKINEKAIFEKIIDKFK